MDFLLPQPKLTWRDSASWRATVQALWSGMVMIAVAYPLVAWMTSQIGHLSDLNPGRPDVVVELARGSLFMLPYLWAYFFALEKISRQDRKRLPPQLLERPLH